ncbi:hypothetical protein [Plebeiibacterium sediminum]|uniref:Uncharacterized protein n=1 Tax=Plebeiibacterium sediminum TaxID=2992112 RepID=A0AAE3MA71_9BACT|nr:hypothetical protein [Plebeiobacterium sediminum]MCW3789669.1 hypothetical protein [Plebeiobacterium sediminum]
MYHSRVKAGEYLKHCKAKGKIDFLGGCFVTFGKSLFLSDLLETVVFAAIVTVVSYFVSMLLKYWFGRKKDV